SRRITSAAECVAQATAAFLLARDERRTVLVNLPLDVQALPLPDPTGLDRLTAPPLPPPAAPDPWDVQTLTGLLADARRPAIIAGRGARHARSDLLALGEAGGALLATSAVAKGLFHGSPWSLDVSGGFASPTAARLIRGADLIVAFGCALNMWTMRHGRLVGP